MSIPHEVIEKIVKAMPERWQDKQHQFEAGVDVQSVVTFVGVALMREIEKEIQARQQAREQPTIPGPPDRMWL